MALDATGRLAGRGAYLCADDACWRTALAKGTLSRALGTPLPAGIRAALEAGPAATTTMTTISTDTTTTDPMTGGATRGEE
jgi:predicted RNA-binding protein YlxR (DUF448 family)